MIVNWVKEDEELLEKLKTEVENQTFQKRL